MLFRKKLANPQESCGSEIPREITASRVRRTVWWPHGVVKQRFATEIRPELNIVLEHTGLGYADIFLSVFMIGSRPSTAVPTIMVSYLDKSVREEAVKTIKGSNVLKDYPEYNFGASALPLNEPVPSQSLGSPEHHSPVNFQSPPTAKNDHVQETPSDLSAPMLMEQERYEILAANLQPNIGRRLFLADSTGKPLRCATGGVVLRIGDGYYQRTVGHIDEKREVTTLLHQSDDLNWCYLEEDAESEDEGEGHPLDHEVTSLGSLSPTTEGLSQGGLSDAGSDSDAVMTDAPASDSHSIDISSGHSDWNDRVKDHQSNEYPCGDLQECPTLLSTGQLRHHSRDGNNAHLDYGLVFLNRGLDHQSVNEVKVNHGESSTSLRVRTVAEIQDIERDIIVVTASNGTTRGKLIPSALYLKSSTQPSLEELFVVHLQGQIKDGDCAAEVLDAQTGDLYGHIVRGCPGTQVAYIRAATDVFEDIQQRLGIVPVIASEDHGKVGPEHSEPFVSRLLAGQQSDDTHQKESSTDPNPNSREAPFACPFSKKDPITHVNCQYFDFDAIENVKQHLKRCHLIVICPRCRIGFNSQDLLDLHLLPQVCEIRNIPDPEGMTKMQYKTIKPGPNHEISHEDQWYFIWDTLFPVITRPQTVYKEASNSLNRVLVTSETFPNLHRNTLPARSAAAADPFQIMRFLDSSTGISSDSGYGSTNGSNDYQPPSWYSSTNVSNEYQPLHWFGFEIFDDINFDEMWYNQ